MKRLFELAVIVVVGASAAIFGPTIYHKTVNFTAAPDDDHSEQCGWTPPSEIQRQQLVGDSDESLTSKAPDFFK